MASANDQFLIVSLYFRPPQFVRIISSEDFELLSLCQGKYTIIDIASKLHQTYEQVSQRLNYWLEEAPGMFVLTSVDEGNKNLALEALRLRRTFNSARKLEHDPDLYNYHKNMISDAHHQFDEVETTMSHIYRTPHPALENRTYGEAFWDSCADRFSGKDSINIIEIGCGVGYFAESFLDRLKSQNPKMYESSTYTMFDLSGALQESQKKICHDHSNVLQFLSGDVVDYDFKDQKYDLVIANEMIADLKVDVARSDYLNSQRAESLGEQYVLRYDLDRTNAPSRYLVNTGAMILIEKIQKLLSDKGLAVLTEYGSLTKYPVALKLGEHNEYSIRFDDLIKVAQKNNLHPDFMSVGKLLGFDENLDVLDADSFAVISVYLLPYLGHEKLKRFSYDRKTLNEALKDVGQIENVQFHPMKESCDLLSPFRFGALVLKK